ncbi:ead/Ea22-like family protein [Klebsiella aerogenes]|uniref:ead/Ea22-like family protein n=1 Tax=Klebsiella aerogenes TaxID=548 RepID=UPI000699F39B|nr:ead/Ea22-like family protein [Klebsiella aerogenes]
MTDITELAQSLKAAAEKATPGQWMRSSVQFNSITDIADPMEQGNKPHIANTSEKRDAEFIAMANPANVLALVEALEKAQQADEELCKLLPPGVEYMDPPDGGDVTPLEGVRRMVADYRQRIAAPESRTVTVKQFDEFQICHYGATEDYAKGYIDCQNNFFKWLTAAGLKWEAE